MNIYCNGEPHGLPATSTLEQFLQTIGCARPGVAVAVNDAIVPAMRWPTTLLNEQDRVLVIQAAQGG